MFKANEFTANFAASLATLEGSEKITKATLGEMSRNLLCALHFKNDGLQGDIGYINRVLAVLTPVNKRTFVLFCSEFTGFIQKTNEQGKKEAVFLKKSKKHYDVCATRAILALDDPHFNLWTWAEKHVDIEKVEKPLDLAYVTKTVTGFFEKAEKSGLSQSDVIKAILAGGVSTDTLLEVMQEMGLAEVE